MVVGLLIRQMVSKRQHSKRTSPLVEVPIKICCPFGQIKSHGQAQYQCGRELHKDMDTRKCGPSGTTNAPVSRTCNRNNTAIQLIILNVITGNQDWNGKGLVVFFFNYCCLVWTIIFTFSFECFKYVITTSCYFCRFLKRESIQKLPIVHCADL